MVDDDDGDNDELVISRRFSVVMFGGKIVDGVVALIDANADGEREVVVLAVVKDDHGDDVGNVDSYKKAVVAVGS